MKKTAVIFSLALVLFSSAVFPRQKGTKKEAEAMVKKAIEYYQKHGAKLFSYNLDERLGYQYRCFWISSKSW